MTTRPGWHAYFPTNKKKKKKSLKEFDATINRAILEYEDSILYLNTDIAHPFPFEPGKLIECIGEICYDSDNNSGDEEEVINNS